jgi:hypothetical protein
MIKINALRHRHSSMKVAVINVTLRAIKTLIHVRVRFPFSTSSFARRRLPGRVRICLAQVPASRCGEKLLFVMMIIPTLAGEAEQEE